MFDHSGLSIIKMSKQLKMLNCIYIYIHDLIITATAFNPICIYNYKQGRSTSYIPCQPEWMRPVQHSHGLLTFGGCPYVVNGDPP